MTGQNIPGMLLSGIAVTFHCLQHWCQCWGSSPQDCITNTLLTEPSPALLCFAGCKINSQLLDANKGALSTVSHLFHEKESASHIANVWDLQPTEKPSALKSCAWKVYLRWLHFLDPSGVISTKADYLFLGNRALVLLTKEWQWGQPGILLRILIWSTWKTNFWSV